MTDTDRRAEEEARKLKELYDEFKQRRRRCFTKPEPERQET